MQAAFRRNFYCPSVTIHSRFSSFLLYLKKQIAVGGHGPHVLGYQHLQPVHRLAQGLADGLGCTACVTAGIHYDNITRAEIEECRRLTDTLLHSALERLEMSGFRTINTKWFFWGEGNPLG